MDYKKPLHSSLSSGRWGKLTLAAQLGNVSSEFGRAARAQESGNTSRDVFWGGSNKRISGWLGSVSLLFWSVGAEGSLVLPPSSKNVGFR